MQNTSTLFGTTPGNLIREFWNTKGELQRSLSGVTGKLLIDTEEELNEYELDEIRDGKYDGIFYCELYDEDTQENCDNDVHSLSFKVCYKTGNERTIAGRNVTKTLIHLMYPYLESDTEEDNYVVPVYFEHETGKDIDEERKDEIATWKETFNDFIAYVNTLHYKEHMTMFHSQLAGLSHELELAEIKLAKVRNVVKLPK